MYAGDPKLAQDLMINTCVNFFGTLDKMQAKFYAVLIKLSVIVQFSPFFKTFLVV